MWMAAKLKICFGPESGPTYYVSFYSQKYRLPNKKQPKKESNLEPVEFPLYTGG